MAGELLELHAAYLFLNPFASRRNIRLLHQGQPIGAPRTCPPDGVTFSQIVLKFCVLHDR
ncbi:hypothetical protein SS05631_b64380 (plasmid) [Sinorhizobium sp. CCBAU 05631]|nr:hypothetical protein SS05631_b64380 [Sinorhizobium sp. CCBAU 05631]